MEHKIANRKGFTIIEVTVVMVLLGILAAILIPSLTGFLDRSAQTARNNNARTLFMAAQTALTNEYARGQKIDPNDFDRVDLSGISPKISSKELTDNAENIYALHIDSGSGGYLKTLLDSYVNDKALLEESILIECNVVTGNVLACFYSDEAASLGYGGAGYNVLNREKGALEAGRVGYYGVEYTGTLPEGEPIGEIFVRLVDYTDPKGTLDGANGGKNYGLLTLELTLPKKLREDVNYTLTLQSSAAPAEGGLAEETITISGGEDKNQNILLSDALTRGSLTSARTNPLTYLDEFHNTKKICAFGEHRANGDYVLVLVLDAPEKALSVMQNYPKLLSGSLAAIATATDGTETVTASTAENGEPPVHTLFAGEGLGTEESPYRVTSVRHLNNLRYDSTMKFQLASDVYCYDTEGAILPFTPLCAPSESPSGFTGTLGGKGFSIVDLTVKDVENAGLFDTLGSGGTAEHLNLIYDDLAPKTAFSGTMCAGGIAAVNLGSIEACTVRGGISSSGTAGGVAGENRKNASIAYCLSATDVSGVSTAGGIAGSSAGAIVYCEVGVASDSASGAGPARITGVPYFGADYPAGSYRYRLSNNYDVENNVFNISASGTTGHDTAAGGVAGRITGKEGRITACVNASRVGAAGGTAGGIAGKVSFGTDVTAEKDDLIITSCYNTGSVVGGSNASAGGRAGGIAGELSGLMTVCYNTGSVNVGYTGSKLADGFYEFNEAHYQTNGSERIHYIGGLVGYGKADAFVTDCYNAAIAGDAYGGVYGLMEGKSTHVRFLQNLHNTEEAYFYRTNQTDLTDNLRTDDDQVVRVSSRDLRSRSWYTDGTFTKGTLDGVGEYFYMLPYYNAVGGGNFVCALGKDYHRTPYEKPLETLGDIQIENISDAAFCRWYPSLADNRGDGVRITFYTFDSSADIKFVINRGQSAQKTVTLSLTESELRQIRNASASSPVTIDRDGSFSSGGLTFIGYSADADAAAKYMGFARAYTLQFPWACCDRMMGSLAVGAAFTLRCDLYRSASDERYAKSNTITRNEGKNYVTVTDSANSSVVNVSVAAMGASMVDKVTVYYPYLNGDESYQVLADGIKNGDVYSNLDAIFTKPNSGTRFHVSAGYNVGAGNFALYKTGTGNENIGILLSTSSSLDGNGDFAANNGLQANGSHVMEPFYIIVEINGATYTSGLYENRVLK